MTGFYDALLQFFWNGPKKKLSEAAYRYWQRKFHPIEDEE